jgi:hypothetical protein
MPKISSGWACPLCDANGETFELYQIPPLPKMLCESGKQDHVWNDIARLKALNPRKLLVPPPVDKPQANHVTVSVSVPASTATLLQQKYGERMAKNLAPVLQACAEARMLLMGQADIERFEDKLGAGINSGAELFGRVYALSEELKQTRTELEATLRKANLKRAGGGEIQVDLGEWAVKAATMAHDSNQQLEEFLSNYLQNSLENDWMTVTG